MTQARFIFTFKRWPLFWRPSLWLRPRNPRDAADFSAGVQAARLIQHENLLPIRRLTSEPAAAWAYAPPLFKTPQPPATPVEAVRIAWHVTRALRAAHGGGQLHGWLRPGCLHRGPRGRVLLGELGLGRVLGEAPDPEVLPYFAPERIQNRTALSSASDFYALGAVLYHLLSGRPPFADCRTVDDFVSAHHAGGPAPLSEAAGPAPLRTLVHRLLSKTPSQRYESAGTLARAIQVAARESNLPVPAELDPGVGQDWQPCAPDGSFWATCGDPTWPASPDVGSSVAGAAVIQLGPNAPPLELRQRQEDEVFAVYRRLQPPRDADAKPMATPFVPTGKADAEQALDGVVKQVELLHAAGLRLHLAFASKTDAPRLARTVLLLKDANARGPGLVAGVNRWTTRHGKLVYADPPTAIGQGWQTWRLLGASGWRRTALRNLMAAARVRDPAAVGDWLGVVQLGFYLRTLAARGGQVQTIDQAERHAGQTLPLVLPRGPSFLRRLLFPPYADILNWGLGWNAGYPKWVRRATAWAANCSAGP